MANDLWQKLLDPAVLKIGWNLARADIRSNFLDCPSYTDVFSVAFEQNINELSKRLSTDTYKCSSLTLIDVPKSTLATRPGSLPELEDRIVLHSIVWLMAPEVDKCLPDAVYSYRLKENPSTSSMFRESDVLDIPFPYLKSKTIARYLDPFDPWYAAWPLFDKQSVELVANDAYKYLVVTDIAAYFENIQLPILRDQLLRIFPEEQRIVNLLVSFLEFWAPRADQIRTFHRGIPQGNQASSFLGNLFLLPLDRELVNFCENHEARYFRYMDDIRVFTAQYPDARKGLLLIDRIVRSLHLNTQSAKTEILCEIPNGDITKRLVDPRLEALNDFIDAIGKKGRRLSSAEKLDARKTLHKIAREKPEAENETAIIGSQKPLRGLTFRAFRRWISAYSLLGNPYYVRFLLREIKRNPDVRLTRKLISVTRNHPNCKSVATHMFNFIRSDLNIFPHQWAEILWSFRYLASIPADVVSHCKEVFLDQKQSYYVRMSAGALVARTVVEKSYLDKCRETFKVEKDVNVQMALANLLMQSSGRLARSSLHIVVFHPNEKVRKLGRLLREVRFDTDEARRRLKFLFAPHNEWAICDNMGLLFSMSSSDRPEILRLLIKKITTATRKSARKELVEVLDHIAHRTTKQLDGIVLRQTDEAQSA